jgi:hypothetical protein
MISPLPPAIRRPFAEGPAAAALAVAAGCGCGQSGFAAVEQPCLAPRPVPDCSSPLRRPGAPMAGPSFSGCRPAGRAARPAPAWQDDADLVICNGKSFESPWFALLSATITTPNRGSHTCANRLSSSPFSPPRLPAACRTRPRAGWPVPQPARSWPMQPRMTCLPARSSVVWLALRPAASNWVCRPAARATEPDPLTPAARVAGRPLPDIDGVVRAAKPGRPRFAFARWPGPRFEGEPCSRRS